MYYLAIDVGTKTLGIAICNEHNKIPSPLTTIRFNINNFNQAVIMLKNKIQANKYVIKCFVIGWPISPNGKLNQATKRVEKFLACLKKQFPNHPYVLQDESYTTQLANEMLFEMNLKGSLRDKNVDQVSATLILEYFLNAQTN